MTLDQLQPGSECRCPVPRDTKGISRAPLSDRIGRVVCNRVREPAIHITVMYLLYFASIVRGYKWRLSPPPRNRVPPH
ncbi:MAG: hypothetical protein A4E57_00334 [Syntrophorhabdaceae bacterium PtaU1.Bin034]|jgi:hypothetical protein|nr:MAG: hypothetical protein A4E57_00334 [Syntrophorhabdaceae bacterium PtaU1.Bin034]